jgi:hypothetical protein
VHRAGVVVRAYKLMFGARVAGPAWCFEFRKPTDDAAIEYAHVLIEQDKAIHAIDLFDLHLGAS